MINVIFSGGNGKAVELGLGQLKAALGKGKTVWVDVLGPKRQDLEFLKSNLLLHELALEDCLTFTQRPKVEEYPKHLFLVVHGISYAHEKLELSELGVFLGKNFLVTVHKQELEAIESLHQRVIEDSRLFRRGPDFLLYQLLLFLVESYFPVLDAMDDTIDEIEDSVFKRPNARILNRTFKLKRAVLELRKTVSPQREIVNSIIREEFPYIKRENILYYRDIYDHLIRMYDLIDTYRDLITGILDAYLSVISNRMNEVMKVLTMIATIMMPLTLIAGIYGMNFQFMPEIHSSWGKAYGYFFALSLMLAVGLIMVFFFKRKHWL